MQVYRTHYVAMTCRSLNKLDIQILLLYILCRGLGMLGNFDPLHCPFAQHIYLIKSNEGV